MRLERGIYGIIKLADVRREGRSPLFQTQIGSSQLSGFLARSGGLETSSTLESSQPQATLG